MKKELIKLANHLDRIGYTKEADYIDNLLKKAEAKAISLCVFSDKYTLSEEEKNDLKSKLGIIILSPLIQEITTEKYMSLNREDKVNFLSDKILAYKKDNEYILNSSYKNVFIKNYGNTIEEAIVDLFDKRFSGFFGTE